MLPKYWQFIREVAKISKSDWQYVRHEIKLLWQGINFEEKYLFKTEYENKEWNKKVKQIP